jgi:hypothetical protein
MLKIMLKDWLKFILEVFYQNIGVCQLATEVGINTLQKTTEKEKLKPALSSARRGRLVDLGGFRILLCFWSWLVLGQKLFGAFGVEIHLL